MKNLLLYIFLLFFYLLLFIFDIFEQFALEQVACSHNSLWFATTIFFIIIIFLQYFIFYNIKGNLSIFKNSRLLSTSLFIEFTSLFFCLFFLAIVTIYPVIFVIVFISLFLTIGLCFNYFLSFSSEFKRLGYITGSIYLYTIDIIEKNIIINSQFYCSLIFETGVCIAFLNVLGIAPFSCSLTSQFLFPLTLSLSFFLFNNILGICGYRFKIFNLFMPKGVPLFITPLLLLIEYISYFARIFSLSIRLCANMLSVHVLLKILVSFTLILLINTLWGQYLIGLLTSILLLDISTCFLQAYIFTFLSLIYLSNIIILH